MKECALCKTLVHYKAKYKLNRTHLLNIKIEITKHANNSMVVGWQNHVKVSKS